MDRTFSFSDARKLDKRHRELVDELEQVKAAGNNR